MNDPYTEEYFLRGRAAGVSLYENYRWLPDLTIPMARAIRDHLGMKQGDSVLDFGCARGYFVRALRELGFDRAYGFDVSDWALKNCDETLREQNILVSGLDADVEFDWVIAKDVFEHLRDDELAFALQTLARKARKGVLIVVPLSPTSGAPYVVAEYEKDVTHKLRWPLSEWSAIVQREFCVGWSVTSQYRLPGVKDNYAHHLMGNGFITVRRISEPSSPS